MSECTINTQTEKRIDVEEWGRALIWLSIGGLLGLAVALPYDRLLGLPGSIGTFLAAAVWGVLLVTFHASRNRGAVEWELDLAHLGDLAQCRERPSWKPRSLARSQGQKGKRPRNTVGSTEAGAERPIAQVSPRAGRGPTSGQWLWEGIHTFGRQLSVMHAPTRG
jgi:hypothetical protein